MDRLDQWRWRDVAAEEHTGVGPVGKGGNRPLYHSECSTILRPLGELVGGALRRPDRPAVPGSYEPVGKGPRPSDLAEHLSGRSIQSNQRLLQNQVGWRNCAGSDTESRGGQARNPAIAQDNVVDRGLLQVNRADVPALRTEHHRPESREKH